MAETAVQPTKKLIKFLYSLSNSTSGRLTWFLIFVRVRARKGENAGFTQKIHGNQAIW